MSRTAILIDGGYLLTRLPTPLDSIRRWVATQEAGARFLLVPEDKARHNARLDRRFGP